MAFERLNSTEKDTILRCMRAAAAYIDDWEKHTRLGLTVQELQQVIAQWPLISDDESGTGFLAINNCLNEVCHGVDIPPNEWGRWFVCSQEEVKSVYQKWLSLKDISGGIR